MDSEDERSARARRHRETAQTLRMLAERIRYDFSRQAQLHALADGFDRLAERVAQD